MNVYLLHTPEYPLDFLHELCDLLNKYSGQLNFIIPDYEFNPEQFSFLKKYRPDFRFNNTVSKTEKTTYDHSLDVPLSWQELFSLCIFYRKTFSVPKTDFIVVLTYRRNALNWFSSFDSKRHIFVHAGDWEYILKAPHKFAVSYQVVMNILQELMDIDNKNLENNPFIHLEPLGCMNDFCADKKQVILKLRTGDICSECMKRLNEKEVDSRIIDQVLDIFEGIRKQLLFSQGFLGKKKIHPIHISAEKHICINETLITFNPLETALFLFFVFNPAGCTLNDLDQYLDEILRYYKWSKPKESERSGQTIKNLVLPGNMPGSTFAKNKAEINRKLKRQLGESLASHYLIKGKRGEAFHISFPQELVYCAEKM